MSYGLIVKGSSALNNESYMEKINHKEAACRDQGPDMDVSDCVNALVAVEDSLIFGADEQETDCTQNDADARVENRDDRCAEISLLLIVTFWVDSSLHTKNVNDEVYREEKADGKD